MRGIRQARDDAIDRFEFADVYDAALQLSGEDRDLALLAILLIGRCGLRIGEFMHLTADLIRWEKGCIYLPRLLPCLCKYCFKRSKENCDLEDPESEPKAWYEYHVENRWSPKSSYGFRYVPFNFSDRVSAALGYFTDEYGYVDKGYPYFNNLIDKVLEHCDLLEPDELNWKGLRGTAVTYWADLAVPPKQQKDIHGWANQQQATSYEGTSAIRSMNTLRLSVNKEPLHVLRPDYVTMDPRDDPEEPWSVERFDPVEYINPYQRPSGLHPRTTDVPKAILDSDIETSKTDFNVLASDLDRQTTADRRAIINRLDSRRNGDPPEPDGLLKDAWNEAALEDPQYRQSYRTLTLSHFVE